MANSFLAKRLVVVLAAFAIAACTASPIDVLDIRPTITNPRYGDNDPHEWQGKAPWEYAVHGIDVSKFQNDINWERAKKAGISFAFIKATEGGDLLDDRFRENWDAARRAGVPRGAYHFYYFCRPAIEQVQWFIKHVPREKNSLPPVLDMEWNHKSPTCKLRPDANTVRQEMRIFLKRLKQHYGKTPIIYTTVDFYRENQLGFFRDAQFWLRSVADHPSNIYPGQKWLFWQYTGTGIVPGIEGDTDINVFHGTANQWKRWVESVTE